MIKAKSFAALKTIIDTNRINLDTTEWVERSAAKEQEQKNGHEQKKGHEQEQKKGHKQA